MAEFQVFDRATDNQFRWRKLDVTDVNNLIDGLTGKIDASLLPVASTDEILEYADVASFPVTGDTNSYYIAVDTNLIYRWSGSVYVKLIDLSNYSTTTQSDALYSAIGHNHNDVSNNIKLGDEYNLASLTTGSGNLSIGGFTLNSEQSGSENVAYGNYALVNHSSGDYNVAIGCSALSILSSGANNIAIGYLAGNGISSSGSNNIIVSSDAFGAGNAGISNNMIIGNSTTTKTKIAGIRGVTPTIGDGQLCIIDSGHQLGTTTAYSTTSQANALYSGINHTHQIANNNIKLGNTTLASVTTGTDNVAIGNNALNVLTEGSKNIAIGSLVLDTTTTGNDNIAIGYNCMTDNVSGESNVALGTFCLDSLTTGNNNVCIGKNAGTAITQGNNNIVVGYEASLNLTTASDNVAMGYRSLWGTTTGGQNTAIGYQSCKSVTNGVGNTGIGYNSLVQINGAYWNTSIGHNSGSTLNQGSARNSFFGTNAGSGFIGSCADNICIGYNAGSSGGTYNSNIFIGTDSFTNSITASNIMKIGNSTTAKTFISGINGISPDTTDGKFVIASSDHQITASNTIVKSTAGGHNVTLSHTGTAVGDDINFKLTAKKNVNLLLHADSDNVDETDNPLIQLGADIQVGIPQSYGEMYLNNNMMMYANYSGGGTGHHFLIGTTTGTTKNTPYTHMKIEPTKISLYSPLCQKEGSNETMGVATLVAGIVTVSTNKVTANSRIYLTVQNNSGTEMGFVRVSSRTASTSFTITSYRGGNTTDPASGDTSDVAWLIIEPSV